MSPTGFNASISGFSAATQRLTVAANNIANQESTKTVKNGVETNQPFQPQEVVQTSLETGGVKTDVRTRDNPTVKVFAPENQDADEQGFIEVPNVNTAEELVNAKIATYDARANLNAIKVQQKLFENTLDIIT